MMLLLFTLILRAESGPNAWSKSKPSCQSLCSRGFRKSFSCGPIWPGQGQSLSFCLELWLEGGFLGFLKNLVSSGISGSDNVKNLCFKGPMKKHLNCLLKDERPGLLKTRVAPLSSACVSRREFRESNVSKNLYKKAAFRGSWILHLLLSVLRTQNSWAASQASHRLFGSRVGWPSTPEDEKRSLSRTFNIFHCQEI